MSKYVKYIGGTLGWAIGGPMGAIMGFVVGSMFDESLSNTGVREGRGGRPTTRSPRNPRVKTKTTSSQSQTTSGDFMASLLILSAAVIKADGKILDVELAVVKKHFASKFGAANANQQMLLLAEVLKQNIPLEDVCAQIEINMDRNEKVHLVYYLFEIAQSDGNIDGYETSVIKSISRYLRLDSRDYSSLKAMFTKSVDSDYGILDISPNCTDDEVKKAYRRMAVKFHPDKVIHLGETHQKAAKEKFQKISAAYSNIKKKRGIR